MPTANREGLIVAAANDLTKALLATSDNSLYPPLDMTTRNELEQLRSIFADKLTPSTDTKQTRNGTSASKP